MAPRAHDSVGRPHLVASFAAASLSVVSYRVAMLSMPFFRDHVLHAPFVNIACPLASDVTLLTIFAGVWLALGLIKGSRQLQALGQTLGYGLAIAVVAAHAAHFRYVVDFGYNLKPFQVVALEEPNYWNFGSAMVLESWQAMLIILLSGLAAAHVHYFERVFGRTELRGLVIDDLTSNVDVAPTLMSMLRWTALKQQFMGQDAFSRTGPVYIDWRDARLSLSTKGDGLAIGEVSQTVKDIFGAATRYDLLAPPAAGASP